MSHAASPFDLKTTMSSSDWRPGSIAGDDLLQFVHLEPVEKAALDRLDQVGRLEPGVLDRVAADEGRALEHDVVELAAAAVVGADGAHERALPQPLAAQHGIGRARDGDDDVALARIAMALAGLAVVPLAERAQRRLGAAVRDDALDPGHRGANARDLRLRLPAAADDAERRCTAPREVLGRDCARRAGSQLAELVGVDHGDELRRRCAKEQDDEAGAVCKARVHLRACVAELEVGGGHHRERAVLEPKPVARPVLDGAGGQAEEARLDRRDRVGGREQLADVAPRVRWSVTRPGFCRCSSLSPALDM